MVAKEKIKIRVENLSVTYSDGTESLRNINLPIYKNKINVILGPSGGGKSSLLRCFNRLNDLADVVQLEGKVLLDGENILEKTFDPITLRRRVGMVFSRPVVLPMSIRENITYGLELMGVRKKKKLKKVVKESLKLAALWEDVHDRLDDPAIALSGGQQQRLCLARVIANEPEVILLDEPTSGLDPVSTLKVEETLQNLKEDYTIVLAPHSIQQAGRTADYVAFFLQGELIEHSPAVTIFTSPQDERTGNYLEGRFG